MPRGLPLLFLALAVGCSSAAEQARDAPAGGATHAPTPAPPKGEPPAAPPPFGNAPADEGEAALTLDFERALYDAIEAGGTTTIPGTALELGCVRARRDEDAHARLAGAAAEQKVPLGPLRLIRLEGPALQAACRPIAASANILAPLFRVRETAASWRVQAFDGPRVGEGLDAALAALGEATPSAPPRVVVVGDKRVALALPLAAQEP